MASNSTACFLWRAKVQIPRLLALHHVRMLLIRAFFDLVFLLMDLRHDDTSEDPDDSSLYDSTWSLNSSTYDPTYESVFWIDGQGTESPPFTPTPTANVDRLTRRTSLVDGLLAEIYSSRTRKATHRRLTEGDVDLTDCLPESSSVIGATVSSGSGSSDRSYLEQLNVLELRALAERWRLRVDEASAQLLGMLKQRERSKGQIEKNCRVVTAVLRSWASRNNLGRAGDKLWMREIAF